MTVPSARFDDGPQSLAAAWLELDPDPITRQQTEKLMKGPEADLWDAFSGRLGFGTAGLRGELGTGPNRMNRVLVRAVASALGSVVIAEESDGSASEGRDRHVIIGFDHRHGSRDFANDSARVLAAAGIRVTLFDDVVPTPLLAFAVRHLDASAGVMVTASHNPRSDNGYKVYWRGGAQIGSPIDRLVSDAIDARPLVGEAGLAQLDHPLIEAATEALTGDYLDAVAALVDTAAIAARPSEHRATVVYSPIHGVGGGTLLRAFQRAGFSAPNVVASQSQPNPDFPGTPFPNPEESGVVDDLLELATTVDSNVALVNDPDADRLAVAVPDRSGWRLLTGDELGAVLAEHLLEQSSDTGDARLVVNTVVSSRLLDRIASAHGATYVESLTGFKWIMQAFGARPGLDPILGYEEALGYSIGSVVNDKDGISAALVVVDLVERLLADGRTLLDVLDDLHRDHGVHVTGQRSIRFESDTADSSSSTETLMLQAMRSLRANPPPSLGGQPVTNVIDLSEGWQHLPATNGVILEVEGGRVVVRPSGTEPKMKIYGEAMLAPDPDVGPRRLVARTRLLGLLDEAVRWAAGAEVPSVAEPSGLLVDHAGPSSVTELRLTVRRLSLPLPEGDDSPGAVRALCAVARRPDPSDPTVGPVASVVVPSDLVALAEELLAGSSIAVGTAAEVEETATAGSGELNSVLVRLWSAQ